MTSLPELESRVATLEARLEAAEREIAAWRRLTVASESGGGQVQVGLDSVVLRINSLTESAAQQP